MHQCPELQRNNGGWRLQEPWGRFHCCCWRTGPHCSTCFCMLMSCSVSSRCFDLTQTQKKKTWMLSATFDQVPPSEPSDWPFLNRNNRRPSDEDREMTADESQRGGDTRRVPKLPSGPVLCSWKVHQRSRSIHVRLPSPQAGKEEWRFHKSVCACVCVCTSQNVFDCIPLHLHT